MLSTKLKEAAGNSADATLYVDDVFSTWLYTGNGSTQTITNGIDLAGKGGLVWVKERNFTDSHQLMDTNRGAANALSSDLSFANNYSPTGLTNFNSNGFSLGSSSYVNGSYNYASWTFREAAKFFDVVTYTGTGSARTIAHNLGIAPGMIFVKRTDATKDWQVYSNGMTSAAYSMQLNLTDPQASAPTVWNSTAPTSSVFSVGTDSTVNASGGTYVAYLFAHDTSSTGIIQCGSYGGNGSIPGPTVSLGWEPQYILVKRATGVNTNWAVFDVMRGMPVSTTANAMLAPNLSDAEFSSGFVKPNATGFQITNTGGGFNSSGETYIYMAIRRPNKPPTTGTQVYLPRLVTEAMFNNTVDLGLTTDLIISRGNVTLSNVIVDFDRLRGMPNYLLTTSDAAEGTGAGGTFGAGQTSVTWGAITSASSSTIDWLFKRAPGFFDAVCYTGTGVARTVAHNLTVVPELMIVKMRTPDAGYSWNVYNASLGNTSYLMLEATYGTQTSPATYWNSTTPTSSVFSVGIYGQVNQSAATYVAYLFATLAGISKVGSYTGNGTGQAIACGFGSGGARFVLIKRTDAAGGWYTFDSARGLTSGSSPYLQLNSTAAEVTGNNGVYASSGGFTLGATAITTTNIATATYIFLAVA
jgi:hypothetical protein